MKRPVKRLEARESPEATILGIGTIRVHRPSFGLTRELEQTRLAQNGKPPCKEQIDHAGNLLLLSLWIG